MTVRKRAVFTVVELDHVCGEFIEFFDDQPGFPQVIAAITAHLAGISSSWFDVIEGLSASEPAITVWRA